MYAIVTDVHFDGFHRSIGVTVLKEDMTVENHVMRTNGITNALIEKAGEMEKSDFMIKISNEVTQGVYELDIIN